MNESGFVSKVGRLVAKDLRIEGRARDTVPLMLGFSVAVVLVLAFALPSESEIGTNVSADVLAGFLWITILFAGLIGFARTFALEEEEGAIDALLLVPLDRSGLFLSKTLVNLAYIVIVEALLVPVFIVLFDIDLGDQWPGFFLVIVLVDIGFVLIGTLFSPIAAQTRSRELILPLLALPILVPVFIAATALTSDFLAGAGWEPVIGRGWFGILVAFDVIFGLAGVLIFEFTTD